MRGLSRHEYVRRKVACSTVGSAPRRGGRPLRCGVKGNAAQCWSEAGASRVAARRSLYDALRPAAAHHACGPLKRRGGAHTGGLGNTAGGAVNGARAKGVAARCCFIGNESRDWWAPLSASQSLSSCCNHDISLATSLATGGHHSARANR